MTPDEDQTADEPADDFALSGATDFHPNYSSAQHGRINAASIFGMVVAGGCFLPLAFAVDSMLLGDPAADAEAPARRLLPDASVADLLTYSTYALALAGAVGCLVQFALDIASALCGLARFPAQVAAAAGGLTGTLCSAPLVFLAKSDPDTTRVAYGLVALATFMYQWNAYSFANRTATKIRRTEFTTEEISAAPLGFCLTPGELLRIAIVLLILPSALVLWQSPQVVYQVLGLGLAVQAATFVAMWGVGRLREQRTKLLAA